MKKIFTQQVRHLISLFVERGGKIVVYSYTEGGVFPVACNTYYYIEEFESREINPAYTEEIFFNHRNEYYDLVFFEDGNVELIEQF